MVKISNEFKTGMVVLISAVLLAIFIISVGKFAMFEKRSIYHIVFNWTNGLDNNAPVRLAGVEIGQVTEVKLDYEGATKVLLTLSVDSAAKIRKDAKAYAATLGLMGEKYIEITPGSKDAEYLEPGAVLQGEDPVRMEELVEIGKEIAAKVDSSLIDIQAFVKNLNATLTDNRGQIDTIIGNLNQTSENFKEFSDDIKRHPWKLIIKGKEEKPAK